MKHSEVTGMSLNQKYSSNLKWHKKNEHTCNLKNFLYTNISISITRAIWCSFDRLSWWYNSMWCHVKFFFIYFLMITCYPSHYRDLKILSKKCEYVFPRKHIESCTRNTLSCWWRFTSSKLTSSLLTYTTKRWWKMWK